MSLPAFLIDFDGTLVDSEHIWRNAEYTFLGSHGLPWSEEAADRLVGGNLDVMADVIADVTGVRFSIPELQDGLQEIVRKALLVELPWIDGAETLLKELKHLGARAALVTSNYRYVVAPLFEALPFSPFSMLVTRDDVARPKPDPEPYILALERLGIDGSDAIALEDSPAGVRSALAAGCHVLGLGPLVADFSGERFRPLGELKGHSASEIVAMFPTLSRAYEKA